VSKLIQFKSKKLLLVLGVILSIAFIDGFIMQSPVLGPQFRGNFNGVVVFFILVVVGVLSQFLSLRYLRSAVLSKPSKKDVLSNKIWLLMKMVYCTIGFLFILLMIQIITTTGYSLSLVLMTIGASNIAAIVILTSLSWKMIRWSRLSRDFTVWSFTITVLLLCVNLVFMTLLLIDNGKAVESFVKPSRCGLMCYSVGSFYVPVYWTTYLISFFAIIASSVILLKGFQTGWQKLKFWTVLTIALVLILMRLDSNLIRNIVDLLNLQVAERHYLNSIILGLIGPLAGIMAGLAFYFMGKSITQTTVKNRVLLISYGVMLFLSLNQSVGLSHFQYPPFGIISISLIPLASYFLFLGVYYSAIYVAQDQKLRTMMSSPNSPVFKELKFLSNIGESENFLQVASGISEIMNNMAIKMEKESGVPSDWEGSLRSYIQSAVGMKLAMETLHKGVANYDIKDQPIGRTWEEWVEQWWKWFYKLPVKVPLQDIHGNFSNLNQDIESIWFLTGEFGEKVKYKCLVPKERAIFFPILKNLISFYEYPYLKNESDLHKYASSEMDKPIELTVFVDDVQLVDAKKSRVRTRLFETEVHSKNNRYEYVSTKAVSDGYWIFLRPLSLGSHVIHVIVERRGIEASDLGVLKVPKSKLELIYEIFVS
jgi:hypothetical protein